MRKVIQCTLLLSLRKSNGKTSAKLKCMPNDVVIIVQIMAQALFLIGTS